VWTLVTGEGRPGGKGSPHLLKVERDRQRIEPPLLSSSFGQGTRTLLRFADNFKRMDIASSSKKMADDEEELYPKTKKGIGRIFELLRCAKW